MSTPIVFYDIPGNANPRKAWSPNTQKTRYSLNYKGIPYKTVWVEYLDIAPLAKKIGAKPTSLDADGKPLYTVPIIHDPSTGAIVSESFEIAQYLDKQYPSKPTLIPAGTDAFQSIFVTDFRKHAVIGQGQLFPLIVAAVNKQFSPYSEQYFRRTREVLLGGKLEELWPAGPKREQKLKELEALFDELSAFMDKNGEGKLFVMGDTISFADFMISSFLLSFKLFAPAEEWQEMASWNGGRWARHLEALKKYEPGVGDETEVWKPE